MVAADPDSQTLVQWLLTAFGLGGGGYKIVTHETRISRLESDREHDSEKLDKVATTVARMDSKLDGIADAVRENRELYVRRRKQHIIDTGGEVED